MAPHTLEFAVVWGLIYLLADVCLPPVKAKKRFEGATNTVSDIIGNTKAVGTFCQLLGQDKEADGDSKSHREAREIFPSCLLRVE